VVKTLHYVTNEPNAHTFPSETQYMLTPYPGIS